MKDTERGIVIAFKANRNAYIAPADYLRFYSPFSKKRGLWKAVGTVRNLQATSQHFIGVRADYTVCIVIPTRDRLDLLRACLDSIGASNLAQNVELLILDNESADFETLEYLDSLKHLKNTRVIKIPGRFDYAGMSNFASSLSDADFLCFVNNDTVFETKDWLNNLLRHFLADSNLGLLGSVLKYPDGTIQHAGIALGDRKLASHIFAGESDVSLRHGDKCFEVTAVTFAVALTPREIFTRLGGLDATFKVGLNDVDYALRLREAGYKVAICGENSIFHHESASRGSVFGFRSAPRALLEVTRFIYKHYPLTKDAFFTSK